MGLFCGLLSGECLLDGLFRLSPHLGLPPVTQAGF
jgi:hypothetical protein